MTAQPDILEGAAVRGGFPVGDAGTSINHCRLRPHMEGPA